MVKDGIRYRMLVEPRCYTVSLVDAVKPKLTDLTLKAYLFDNFVDAASQAKMTSEELVFECLRDIIGRYHCQNIGEFGIAFFYALPKPGCEAKKESGSCRGSSCGRFGSMYCNDSPIKGANLFIYRGTLDDALKPKNQMIHSWTIENTVALDRSKDITLCEMEAIILGKEAEHRRQNAGDKNAIINSWPDIGDLLIR